MHPDTTDMIHIIKQKINQSLASSKITYIAYDLVSLNGVVPSDRDYTWLVNLVARGILAVEYIEIKCSAAGLSRCWHRVDRTVDSAPTLNKLSPVNGLAIRRRWIQS
jgi:hypothetical protein